MNQKKKVIALAAITVMLLAPLAAQSSNTNAATAGTFETDVDNYMSVNDFGTVKMDKALGFVRVDSENLDLGYARKIGGFYLGTYYFGDILTANADKDTYVDTFTYIDAGYSKFGEDVATDTYEGDVSNSNNSAAVLIGIAGMGFNLSVSENLETATGSRIKYDYDGDGVAFDDINSNGTQEAGEADEVAVSFISTDSVTGVKTVSEFSDVSQTTGYITPSLAWGMNLGLGSATLKPFAGIRVAMNQNSFAATYDDYTQVNGQISGVKNNTTYGYAGGSITPALLLGADFVFAKKDTAQTTVGLRYNFELPLYSNTYKNYKGSDVQVAGTGFWRNEKEVEVTATEKTTDYTSFVVKTEQTGMTHTITPSYQYSNDVTDRVSLGFNASASIGIASSKTVLTTISTTASTVESYSGDLYDSYTSTTVTTSPGSTEESVSLNVEPTLGAGLTWKLVPEKFSVHAGLTVTAPAFSSEVVTSTVAGGSTTTTNFSRENGYESTSIAVSNPTRNEEQNESSSWSNLTSSFSAGMTLNVTKNAAFDLLFTTLPTQPSIMGAGSLLESPLSLLFTIKY